MQDLFGNMPVRVKQRPQDESGARAREREWNYLCRSIVGLLLAWHKEVSLTMKSKDKDQCLRIRPPVSEPDVSKPLKALERGTSHQRSFDLSLIRYTLVQSLFIDSYDWESWVKTSARTPSITIRAVVSLEPAPSRECQFISLGMHHVLHEHGYNALYEEVNRIFKNSNFGASEVDDSAIKSAVPGTTPERIDRERYTKRELRGGTKGVDRWPMFYIRIDLNDSSSSSPPLPSYQIRDNGMRHRLSSITRVLNAMIVGFLHEHHFRPSSERPKRQRPGPDKSEDDRLPRTMSSTDRESVIKRSSHDGKSRSSSRNPSRFRNLLNDLDTQTRLPKFAPNRASQGPESLTFRSRIKVGSRGGIAETGDTTAKSSAPVPLQRVHNRNISLEADSPKILQEKAANITPASDVKAEVPQPLGSTAETLISWTDPFSRTPILINARTGFVINTSSQKPPLDGSRPQSTTVSWLADKWKIHRTSGNLGHQEKGPWARSLLESWENPVFSSTEEAIPQISLEEVENIQGASRNKRPNHPSRGTFLTSVPTLEAKLNRSSLRNATIIAHVDFKYILAKLDNAGSKDNGCESTSLVVLIDQHAADERIKLEELLADLCQMPSGQIKGLKSDLGYSSAVDTIRLQSPIIFDIHTRDFLLFERHAGHFADWGILYNLSKTGFKQRGESQAHCCLAVLTIPSAIAERCRADPKQLIEVLRGEAWNREEASSKPFASQRVTLLPASESIKQGSATPWMQRIHACPKGILDMINSRACRSAIMFNDELSQEQCEALVHDLSTCHFPFQCAHGRPSMVPLVELGRLGKGSESGVDFDGVPDREGRRFEQAWIQWKEKEG